LFPRCSPSYGRTLLFPPSFPFGISKRIMSRWDSSFRQSDFFSFFLCARTALKLVLRAILNFSSPPKNCPDCSIRCWLFFSFRLKHVIALVSSFLVFARRTFTFFSPPNQSACFPPWCPWLLTPLLRCGFFFSFFFFFPATPYTNPVPIPLFARLWVKTIVQFTTHPFFSPPPIKEGVLLP